MTPKRLWCTSMMSWGLELVLGNGLRFLTNVLICTVDAEFEGACPADCDSSVGEVEPGPNLAN